ncbi:MAG TPA: energy transducer TonB [Acidiphilium sp.]
MRRPATTRPRGTDPEPAAGHALGGAARPWIRRRYRRDGWAIPLPVSLAVHVAIILFILYLAHEQKLIPAMPESGIAVVFQNTGVPHTASENAAPRANLRGPQELPQLPPPPPPPPSARPAPPQPPAAPQMEVNLSPPPLPQFTPPKVTVPVPMPVPKPEPERQPARGSASGRKFMVMNGMSFGKRQSTVLNPRASGALNLSMSNLPRAPEITFKGNAGPDWESAFNKWVNEHKYYPEAAAENGQSGSVTVGFTVLPDGRVTDLKLLKRSGAPLLDMAWYGLFRGVHVPRFPPGSKAKSEHVIATIHYILIR